MYKNNIIDAGGSKYRVVNPRCWVDLTPDSGGGDSVGIEWIDEIPEGTTFGCNSFSTWTPFVKSVHIPEGVTEIAPGCFAGNYDNIENIYIPDTVTIIQGGAFIGCYGLKELVIPDTVQEIGTQMLPPNLVKLVLGNGITSIPKGFMPGGGTPETLEEFIYSANLKRIESGAMAGAKPMPLVKSIELPDSLEYIGASGIESFTGITYLSIPGSVQEVWQDGISNCTSLTKVDICEGNLTALPKRMFYNCPTLAEINIPNNVSSIDEGAFEGCTGLATINIDTEENSVAGAPWGAPETVTVNWLR